MPDIPVYPRIGTTYPDANGVPITSAGAIVASSKYISDAIRAHHLLTPDDPLGIYEPDDRTGIPTGSGGTGTALQNYAELQAAAIPSSTDALEIMGCVLAGDGGGATLKRITSGFPPVGFGDTYLGCITAGDGSVWVYVPDARGVNARFFGALGEATTPALNRRGIQNALDFDMYYAKTGVTYLPAGRYEVDDTIHLGYGATTGGTTHSVTLEGDGPMTSNFANFGGSIIVATESDRPCIAVSGARTSRIRNLAMEGPNYDWIQSRNLGTSVTSEDAAEVADWVDPALHANANSRYAPLAGVAVDPYQGTAPSPAYPDVAFPPFMDGTAQYGKTPSSDVKLEKVWIGGFVVAVVVQPCDADANGDFISLRDCFVQSNTYAISVGNTQARLINADNTTFVRFHSGIVNSVHGKRQGKVAGEFSNCLFEACINWFDLPDATRAGPLRFTNCYGEEVYRIGLYGGNAADNKPLTFDACQFSFSTQDSTRGAPTYVLEAQGQTPISFKSCDFGLYHSVMVFGGVPECYSLEDCSFSSRSSRTNMYEKLAHNFTAGGVMFQPYYDKKPRAFSGKLVLRYNASTGATSDTRTISSPVECSRDLTIPAWCTLVTPTGTPGKYYRLNMPWQAIDKGSVTSSVSGTTLTLSGYTHVPELSGGAPGDVIYDATSGTVFFVRSLSGGTILAEAQNNILSGSLVTAYNGASGTLWAGVARVYTPSSYIRGTLSSGSSTVSSVARPDGFGGALSSYIADGDFVQVDPSTQLELTWPLTKAGATLSSVTNGSPGSFALGSAPFVSETRDLAFFVRQPPSNV